jgi:hypothetical protein
VAVRSLSRFQTLIGVLASISSVIGAGYSAMSYLTAPGRGEVAALVRDAKTERPLRDATVEILRSDDALVTTLAPAEDGWVHRTLREGSYRVRVTHPQLGSETRAIEVVPGEKAVVRFQLGARGEGTAQGGRGWRTSRPVSRLLSNLGL